MAFDIAFGIFAALLVVLTVFVVRFARGLAAKGADGRTMRERAWERAQERARRRSSGMSGTGPPAGPGDAQDR